jgi:hypothetical protein
MRRSPPPDQARGTFLWLNDDFKEVRARQSAQLSGSEKQAVHSAETPVPARADEPAWTVQEEILTGDAVVTADSQEEINPAAFPPQPSDLVTSLGRGVLPVWEVGLQITEQVKELAQTLAGSGTEIVFVSCVVALAAAGIASEVVRRQAQQAAPRLGLSTAGEGPHD